jgi:multidrug efflux system membrane fusion protein
LRRRAGSEVHFREAGGAQGDLLFSIDPRSFEAALRQAEANLRRHRAEAQNARTEAQRLTQLLAQQIVSQDEYMAQTQAAAMNSTVDAERATVDTANCSSRTARSARRSTGASGEFSSTLAQCREGGRDDAGVNQIRPIYVRFSVPRQTPRTSATRRRAGRCASTPLPTRRRAKWSAAS